MSSNQSNLVKEMLAEVEKLIGELQDKIDVIKQGTDIAAQISPLMRYLKMNKVKSPILTKTAKLLEKWEEAVENASMGADEEYEED